MAGIFNKLLGIQPGRDIDFMGLRTYFIGGSMLLVLASFVALFYPGPRWGTDFSGGTEVEAVFGEGIDAGAVREAVQKSDFESPDVVGVDSAQGRNQFIIRVKEVTTLTDEQKASIERALCLVPEEGGAPPGDCPEALRTSEVKFSPGGDKITARYEKEACGPAEGEVLCPPRADIRSQLTGKVEGIELRKGTQNPFVQNPRDNKVEFFLKSRGDQIIDGLRVQLGDKAPEAALRVEWVGPKAGKQLRDAAIKSIAIALIFIMVYVAFRFDMRFAPGGIIALIHDAAIATGAMILTGREVTLSTVAALLTIIGFSINDTVVVYDRIRENLGRHRHMTFPAIINRSITEMLGRTFKTSATTMLSITPFMFWGTGVIKDFAFCMLVGCTAGIYSSIYIAAPLTEIIDKKIFRQTVKKKRRVVRRKKEAESVGAPA